MLYSNYFECSSRCKKMGTMRCITQWVNINSLLIKIWNVWQMIAVIWNEYLLLNCLVAITKEMLIMLYQNRTPESEKFLIFEIFFTKLVSHFCICSCRVLLCYTRKYEFHVASRWTISTAMMEIVLIGEIFARAAFYFGWIETTSLSYWIRSCKYHIQ